MTRSTEFGATVNQGVRAVQPDIVVHALPIRRRSSRGPKVGLVVVEIGGQRGAATPGGPPAAARRARHLDDLDPADRVVIRALPEQSARDLRRGSNRNCGRRCNGPGSRRGTTMSRRSGRRVARRSIFLIQLYRNTVSPLRSADLSVHPDVQSVRGRRAQ